MRYAKLSNITEDERIRHKVRERGLAGRCREVRLDYSYTIRHHVSPSDGVAADNCVHLRKHGERPPMR
eukprot:1883175-Pyramimonas_sp.AAC.1